MPPIFSMLVFTTSMPTPRPETLVICLGGREAGQEDQADDLAVAHPRGLLGRDQPALHGLPAQHSGSMPAPLHPDQQDH